ncbi:kinase-like protein [Sistotremastrum suecicum HHB10207 ss-3]|uniref:Kinase-like protein n=1 Tax=Sistotremastrum suecicum HHB10207 ss-3 TaxID=1314776 RepID=A0A166D2I3_9AGAM|nr:kinase-like protein [Sistotremastrum suecicum HHB10207 ss-3]
MSQRSPSTTSSINSILDDLVSLIDVNAITELVCSTAGCDSCKVGKIPKQVGMNLVYTVHLSSGDSWIARFPHPLSYDPVSMEADLRVLMMIRSETTIPVPQVYAYDVTAENVVGLPYSLLSDIPGVPLGENWEENFDDEKRHRLLDQVAENILQLRKFEFPVIGSLIWDHDGSQFVVGPLRGDASMEEAAEDKEEEIDQPNEPDEENTEESQQPERGPFTSTRDLLKWSLLLYPKEEPVQQWAHGWLRLFAAQVPNVKYDGPPFVLRHPDLDAQNVIIDPVTGDLRGFINWDGVGTTVPRECGYASYPSWITMDWSTIFYAWEMRVMQIADAPDDERFDVPGFPSPPQNPDVQDNIEAVSNDPVEVDVTAATMEAGLLGESPAALAAHREYYHSIIARLDPELADITRNSHVLLAMFNGILTGVARREAIDMLVDYYFKCTMNKGSGGEGDGVVLDRPWHSDDVMDFDKCLLSGTTTSTLSVSL